MSEFPQIEHIDPRAGYDLWAPTYDTTENPVVALDARHSLRILDPQPAERILDAGCGTGRHLRAIVDAGASVVGIDFSAAMLGMARNAGAGCGLAAADLRASLPFHDGAFDAVLCSLVGEHLADLVAPLSEFRRVTRPGGRLVFSVYHPEVAAQGVEATFVLDGTEYRLGAEQHSVQDYLDAVVDAGFDEVAFATFRGAEGSGRYAGQPLLFLVAATVAAES